jgi:membrane protein DedA with SNARE-associated domain
MVVSVVDYGLISDLFQWQKNLAHNSWHWIEAHGYWAMFVLLFSSGIGLPLPEDVPLTAAGVFIARGSMRWVIAAPLGWVAMMFGDSALYILGYLLGWRVVHLPMIGRHVSAKRLQKCEQWFHRWGAWAVGIGRMFMGIRSAMVVAAGTMRMNYLKMLIADGLAAMVTGGAFMIFGYWAGLHAGSIGPIIEEYRQVFSIIALVAAVALIVVLRLRARRRIIAAAKPMAMIKEESGSL